MWHYHGRKRPAVSQCKLSAVELQHGIILDKRFHCITKYKLSAVETLHNSGRKGSAVWQSKLSAMKPRRKLQTRGQSTAWATSYLSTEAFYILQGSNGGQRLTESYVQEYWYTDMNETIISVSAQSSSPTPGGSVDALRYPLMYLPEKSILHKVRHELLQPEKKKSN